MSGGVGDQLRKAFAVFDRHWSNQNGIRLASRNGVRENYWQDGYKAGLKDAQERQEKEWTQDERLMFDLASLLIDFQGRTMTSSDSPYAVVDYHLEQGLCSISTGPVYSGAALIPGGPEKHKRLPCFELCGKFAADGSVHVQQACSERCSTIRARLRSAAERLGLPLEAIRKLKRGQIPEKPVKKTRRFKRLAEHL